MNNAGIPSPNIVQQGNYIGNMNFASVYMSPNNPNPYQSNTFNSNMPGMLNNDSLQTGTKDIAAFENLSLKDFQT